MALYGFHSLLLFYYSEAIKYSTNLHNLFKQQESSINVDAWEEPLQYGCIQLIDVWFLINSLLYEKKQTNLMFLDILLFSVTLYQR